MRMTRATRTLAPSVAGLLLAAAGGALAADDAELASSTDVQAQLDAQTRQIERLQRELARQEAALADLKRTVELQRRGRGDAPAPAAAPAVVAQAPAEESPRPVGQAPAAPERPPEVAPIFEQPGVLTPPGKWIAEPVLQYSYSSSDRIALVGYTVIPAILIGLIDVRTVKSNALTATLALRRGITNRFEMEARIPYVYRFDTTRGREVFQGTATDDYFIDQDGKGIGDVELIGRYQLNDGGGDSPYYIASMRLKARTGKDPFEVRTAYTVEGARTSGVQEELPTGSGFYSITPGLTVLVPSDPAVFFGGISYQYSFKRKDVTLNAVDLPEDFPAGYAEIQPGGVWGFNFGMGLALNERSSFSIGYDHLSVAKTNATFPNGEKARGVRVQLGSLLLGYSHKLNPGRTLNLSLGVGVTNDTPDVQLTMRMPISF